MKNQCTARTSSTGARCRKAPVKGATVCAVHGGSAPQVQAAAARRVATAEAVALAHELGLPIQTTPERALLDALNQSAGVAAFYGGKVQQIVEGNPRDLVWGHTRTKTGGDDAGATYEAKPSVWLQLWNEERDRIIRISTAALRLEITEKQQLIAAEQARTFHAVVMATFAELGLTADQIQAGRDILADRLRRLAAIDDIEDEEV